MGAWGTGISSNDTYADIYDRFFDLYNDGLSVSEASSKLIRENQETIGISEDAPNFWYALAKAQWECKELSDDVKSRVEHFIKNGEDLEIWKELGATQADLKARAKVLTKFLTTLQSEKTSAKKRKKKRLYDSVFRKGDCLVYKMDNGNYGGAFVLTEEKATEVGVNYIAITTIDKPQKPTLDDFRNGDVYLRWTEEISFKGAELQKRWVDQPQIGGVYAFNLKQKTFPIEVIGNLPMYKEYMIDRIVGFGWRTLQLVVPMREQYERSNGKPQSRLKLATWIKKRSLFGW